MNINFSEIIEDIAWRTNDGSVDWRNPEHVDLLRTSLRRYGVPEQMVSEVCSNIKERFARLDEYSNDVLKAAENDSRIASLKNPETGQNVKLRTALDYAKKKDNPTMHISMRQKFVDVANRAKEIYDEYSSKVSQAKEQEKMRQRAFADKQKDIEKQKELSSVVDKHKYKNKINMNFMKYDNDKISPRYLKLLNSVLNMQYNENDTRKLSLFDPDVGAGEIRSQIGELLTILAVSNPKAYESFYKDLSQQIKQRNKEENKNSLLTDTWLKSGAKNKNAIFKFLNTKYKQYSIESVAWDSEKDLKSIGFDYSTKSSSTDIVIKVKLPTGKYHFEQISLKKDTNVNFLNSTMGVLDGWSQNSDIKVFQKHQKDSLKSFIDHNRHKISNLINTSAGNSLRKTMKSKKILSIDDAYNSTNIRKSNKVMLEAAVMVAKSGDKSAQHFLEKHKNLTTTFINNAVKELTSVEKLKNQTLELIRTELPIKDVSEGHETIIIGDLILDIKIMNAIFGTSDFNKIRENLITITDEIPPYIGYQMETSNKIIPIALLKLREDGVGYGSSIKLEMTLDNRFAVELKQKNKEVYGK